MGCLLQMNKESISGGFGEDAQAVAEFMLENGVIDCIASDSHSPYSRTTFLEDIHETVAGMYSDDYADLLLKINPMNIICNKDTEIY